MHVLFHMILIKNCEKFYMKLKVKKKKFCFLK